VEQILGLVRSAGLKAALVVLIYAALSKVVDLILTRILKRLFQKTPFTFDDELLEFIHAPVTWSVFLLGCIHANLYLEFGQPWDEIVLCSLQSILTLVWWLTAFRMTNWAIQRYSSSIQIQKKERFGRNIFFFFKNIIRLTIIGIGVFLLLSVWKVNLTPLFASAGIAGIAVALAAKDTLANFFGGISIFADKSFKVGDYIILDSGERGEVVDIGIRSTKMKTRDDVMITMPNSILANAKIINESAPEPRFRLRIPIGVAYGSDLDLVEEVLLGVASAHSLVSEHPEPRVRLRQFGESSIDMELLCWVNRPANKGIVLHEILKAVYKIFNERGISIPFPQRDIHLFPQEGTKDPVHSVAGLNDSK